MAPGTEMENQHTLIKGYRDLSQEEIDQINAIKGQGLVIKDMLDKISELPGVDARWLAIARTHLQEGFMCAVRSIAKPEGF